MADINSLAFRDEIVETIPADMDLPAQGGSFSFLAPGVDLFRVPANIAQLIETFDDPERGEDGKPIPGSTRVIQRVRVKFKKENPLIIVGGKNDGEALTATISNIPFKKGKKDSDAPKVAEMLYLIRVCFQDKAVLQRSRDWYDALVRGAGKIIRLKHGLRGRCDPERIRYIDDGQGGVVPDPAGTMGCGKGYYTKSFKKEDESGTYDSELVCECGAIVRAFPQIEEYLPPLA